MPQTLDTIDCHIGSRLRKRRNDLSLTQENLGKAIGTSFQQVQKYETGQNKISASRLFLIAAYLGVPITYFFEIDNVGPTGSSRLETTQCF